MTKQHRHSLTGKNYKFECDDTKLFEMVEQFINSVNNPTQIPAEKLVTPAVINRPYPVKDASARAYRCIAMNDPQRKIAAIKQFRELTGYGLADSKEWCESTRVLQLDASDASVLWTAGFVLQML